MDLIKKYFPKIDSDQIKTLERLIPLYTDWNQKVNVISRKDIENLEVNHILHSLSIAKFMTFPKGARVLDLGTGGGFPGVPLAILSPETSFTLIDGTLKKINVVKDVVEQLELKNVTAIQMRAEEIKAQFDYVITRAVAPIDKLYMWCERLVVKKNKFVQPNGIIALKGGDLKTEMKSLPRGSYHELTEIQDYFDISYYENKYIVYVQM